MTNRESMLQVISDLSKDAHGFRVRLNYDAMSDAELQRTWDGFVDELEASQVREARAAINAQRVWEARIQNLIAMGAGDRATALRWDIQAMDANHGGHLDTGYYCYLCGLAYELEAQINEDLNNRKH